MFVVLICSLREHVGCADSFSSQNSYYFSRYMYRNLATGITPKEPDRGVGLTGSESAQMVDKSQTFW